MIRDEEKALKMTLYLEEVSDNGAVLWHVLCQEPGCLETHTEIFNRCWMIGAWIVAPVCHGHSGVSDGEIAESGCINYWS